jgi:PAS domain S-box-containing protein
MGDWRKTKARLLAELDDLRRRMDRAQAECSQWAQALSLVRESEERFRWVFENSMEALLLTCPDGGILEANDAACALFQRSREEILRLGRAAVVDPSDPRLPEALEERVRTGRLRGELSLRRKDGTTFPAEVISAVFPGKGGPWTSMAIRDLTRVKETEESLRRHQEEFRVLADNVPGLFSRMDREGRYRFVNKAYEDWFGVARDEILGRPVREIIGEEAFSIIEPRMNEALSGREVRFQGLMPFARGGDRWVAVHCVPDLSASGTVEGYYALVTDITDLKAAQETLAASESRARQAARESAVIAEIGRIVSSTLRMEDVYGRFAEVVTQIIAWDRISVFVAAPDQGGFRVAHTAGLDVPGRQVGDVVPSEGTITRAALAARSVIRFHARSEEEVGLHYPELMPSFRMGVRAWLAVPLVIMDRVAGCLHIQSRRPDAFGGAQPQLARRIANQIAGAVANAELFCLHQEALKALAESEERYRALVESSHDHLFLLSPEGVYLTSNWKGDREGTGQGPAPLVGRRLRDFYPPEIAEAYEREMGLVLSTDAAVEFEHTLPGAHGERCHQDTLYPVHRGGELWAVGGICRDVTERKQYEEATRRLSRRLAALHDMDRAILAARSPEEISDAALSRIVEVVPVQGASVCVVDPGAKTARVLAARGPGEDQAAAGTTAPLERDTLSHEACLGRKRVVEDMGARPGPSLGEELPVCAGSPGEVNLPIVIGEDLLGSLKVAVASPGGPTEEDLDFLRQVADSLGVAIRQFLLHENLAAGRRRLQALSHRLLEVQEEERRGIARELHDEVGQLVTGLKLTLEMAGRGDERSRTAGLGEAVRLADELLARVRDLSLDLRPAMLDDLGLVPALLWQIDRFHCATKIRVAFRHRNVEGRRFPRELETAVFRIGQEALTNVARHAGVSEAAMSLWADGESLWLRVEDGGRGFDARAVMAGWSGGMGGIRERVNLLGGKLDVEAAEGKGCRVSVELPLTGGAMERRKERRDPHRLGR